MTTNFDDDLNFKARVSFNGLSCNQASSLSGLAFAGYSTNGGTPVRNLTDASTLANVISYLKTLTDDLLRTK